MKTFCVAPVLRVSNLEIAMKYFLEVLGFAEDFRFGDYAGVKHGEVAIHLCVHDFQKRPIGGGAIYVFCDEVDSYCNEIKARGAVVEFEPGDRPYGMRDFTALDLDGNRLNFGCEIPVAKK